MYTVLIIYVSWSFIVDTVWQINLQRLLLCQWNVFYHCFQSYNVVLVRSMIMYGLTHPLTRTKRCSIASIYCVSGARTKADSGCYNNHELQKGRRNSDNSAPILLRLHDSNGRPANFYLLPSRVLLQHKCFSVPGGCPWDDYYWYLPEWQPAVERKPGWRFHHCTKPWGTLKGA